MTIGTTPAFNRRSILADGKPHPGRSLTEAEFMKWIDEDTRAEWVDGEVVMMAPSSLDHAGFSLWVAGVVREFVSYHNLGSVYGTEVLVRLPRQRRRRLPDLLFVSKERSSILHSTYVDGAPDMILEVVSPESVARDWREKYLEYERAGVREYWIVHRQSERVEVYSISKSGQYRPVDSADGIFRSSVLKGFYLRLSWMLSPDPPSMLAVLRELGVK
ncbi:MAG TPA: Uma2 family endonuclease [Tepidisphaeraceae bacterium]|jgi:Uma2 family endonuclease|nr:Uma2 family endonuclease [Tepidisphaeraceae bacterium]